MRQLLQPAFLIFGIAIFLTMLSVAIARRKTPEIRWLFYRNDSVLHRLDLESGHVKHLPDVNVETFSTVKWSQDGRWIIYEQNGNLFRRDHIGHMVQQMTFFPKTEEVFIWVGSVGWNVIYYDNALYKLDDDASNLQHLSDVSNFDRFFSTSYDRQRLLFSTFDLTKATDDPTADALYLIHMPTGKIRQLTESGSIGRWSLGDEWIVFLALENGKTVRYQIRPDGSELQPIERLVRIQTNGHVSPDEEWILIDYEYPVGLMKSDGTEFRELSHIPNLGNTELFAVWSADSNGFITAAEIEDDDDMQEFYWNSIDGSERHLIENSTLPRTRTIERLRSPDRNYIVLDVAFESSIQTQLVLLPTNGDPAVQLTTRFSRIEAWSSDSKWIVFSTVVGECCFPHNHPNELFRMYLEDGRVERLTYTADDEYPTYMGMAPIVELAWDWWIMLIGGLMAIGLSVLSSVLTFNLRYNKINKIKGI